MKNKYGTPIVDFLNEYERSGISRLHMPGHKGKAFEGDIPLWLTEAYRHDITEIAGADNLFAPEGIIRESEENASDIFGCKTLYSTEGSSLSIKAMIYLALKHFEINHGPFGANEKPYIITIGMCHKAFFHAVELLNIRVKRVEGNSAENRDIQAIVSDIKELIKDEKRNPIGVYLTYPDYFGNVTDLKEIKEELDAFEIPLLADGAHSAYFRFLDNEKYGEYAHPALYADICAVSAHKTLPTLTGASYLHINESFRDIFPIAKRAMDLFGSSSPSYLIMASLDMFNSFVGKYEEETTAFSENVDALKNDLKKMGFTVKKSDPLRIVVLSDEKYNGEQFAAVLRENKCEPECSDEGYVIMMLSPLSTREDLERIRNAFRTLNETTDIKKGNSGSSYDCLKNFS
ncbi:MAG: amino acid decarboxylase [Lachnospiraceae bacterium]|nr:amino acid decarboxylase [Lachnospiraceae bacterium]